MAINTFKTGILMAALFGLFMLIGRALGGANGLIIGFLLALGTNGVAYWFSDKIAIMSSGAQPVTEAQAPQLYHTVARVAQRAGMPMPQVYIVPSPQPNAFATGRDPQHAAVAATQGILQALTPEELEGVLAHEMAHVKHRDILISSIAATVAGAITLIAHFARFAMIFGGYGRDDRDRGENPIVALALLILAPIAAMLIQLAISRSREFEADRGGAEISGNPLALAGALRKIERYAEAMPMNVPPSTAHMYIQNPLGGDRLAGFAALFRTHPATPERIARLEAMAAQMHGQPTMRPDWT